MKNIIKSGIVAVLTLGGALNIIGAPVTLVNETFDPPSVANPLGWDVGSSMVSCSVDYVNQGVGGSMAVQISGVLPELPDWEMVGAIPVQASMVVGNDLATPENTVLSFDIKTDRADFVGLAVYLQSWDYFWYATFLPGNPGSSARITEVGPYVPGTFKTITIPVSDPLWADEGVPYNPGLRTTQIMFAVGTGSFSNQGPFTVTIDNVRLTSKNNSVPWNTKAHGTWTMVEGNYIVVTSGQAEHLGAYTETTIYSATEMFPVGSFSVVAANGDTLSGKYFGTQEGFGGYVIENGTGRFLGAKGSYLITRANALLDGTVSLTQSGRISNVGWSK